MTITHNRYDHDQHSHRWTVPDQSAWQYTELQRVEVKKEADQSRHEKTHSTTIYKQWTVTATQDEVRSNASDRIEWRQLVALCSKVNSSGTKSTKS